MFFNLRHDRYDSIFTIPATTDKRYDLFCLTTGISLFLFFFTMAFSKPKYFSSKKL
jgi:hypothetical protein